MNEDIKKEIREIIHTYCGGNYENRRMATELILQKCQEKQLTLTDVVVPKETLPNNCKGCGRTIEEMGKMTSMCGVSACPNNLQYLYRCTK